MFADTTAGNETTPVINEKNPNKIEEGKVLGEVQEKRTKNSKQFYLDNHTYKAAIYPTAVHYLENGKWKDIDNTIIEGKDELNKDVLENKANDYKVKIAKKANSNKLVKFQKGDYQISWSIDNVSDVAISNKELKQRDLSKLSENQKSTLVNNLTSIVEFKNVFNNIDLQYVIGAEQLKENFIINQKVDNPQFSLRLATKGLIATLQDDKSIVFYDEKDNSKEIFKIDPMYMYDAAGEISQNINVSLAKDSKGEYNLIITPDNQWLSDSQRVYPVTIDPTIPTSLSSVNIFDSYVAENLPTSNYGLIERLKVGRGATSGSNRSYISFALPTLKASDMIINADLNLDLMASNSGEYQVNVHPVTSAWTSGAITWSNQPSFVESTNPAKDYQLVQLAGTYSWDITPIAKSWYVTGNNYGLMLKAKDEAVTGYSDFYSSDANAAYIEQRPRVEITYVNYSGLESYWTYHAQSAGRAGIGYVNDYNGNLIFNHNDIAMNGNRMPISINHVFNSNEKDINIGYGNGWRLSLSQTIKPETIGTITYYAYIDEDGTKHYFKPTTDTTVYVDESGMDLTLKIDSPTSYTIKDKSDNKLNFISLDATSTRYLKTITDANGNVITLGYQGTVLNTVTDPVNRTVTLNYTNGLLSSIVDPSIRTTSYAYTGTNLTKITYPDTKFSTYNYNANKNMNYALNFDGYKANFTYYAAAPYRVNKIQEINSLGAIGQELTLSYGNNVTNFTDAVGNKLVYQFNDNGNTVSIKDNQGYANNYQYATGSNINKLSLEGKLQKTTKNYLKNHNLEFASDWTASNTADSTGTSGYATDNKYFGLQSIKINKTNVNGMHAYQQNVVVTKGNTYTLSGYVKTNAVSNTKNMGAQLYVAYQDNTGAWKKIESEYVNGTTNGWQRIELTFTLPVDSVSTTVQPKLALNGESGTAYFDTLQLEDGNIANRYNLVENADFSYGSGDTPSFWTKNTTTDATDTWINYQSPAPGMDSYNFKFTANAKVRKNIYQYINESGLKDDVITLGGWAKADSAPVDGIRVVYALTVGLTRNDNTVQWETTHFNQDSTDWQYAVDRIVADADYKKITVFVTYYNNINTAYFDGIQLYKEEFGQSYQYDNKGNVVSSADLAKTKAAFEYDASNDLINQTNPNGGSFTYEYDKHQPTVAKSAENVVYNFTYDSHGNPLTSSVGAASPQIKSSATYTADGNYINTLTDDVNNTVTYNFNTTKGLLDSFVDANTNTTNYQYDSDTDDLKEVYTTVDGQEIRNSYSYENDSLKQITHNGFNYIFDYDKFGNNTSVNVGTQNLITNTFDTKIGILDKSVYGNGQTTDFNYDNLNRVKEILYNSTKRYEYKYDNAGNVGFMNDLVNNVSYRYIFDLADRLAAIADSQGNTTKFSYDSMNNVTKVSEKINGENFDTSYSSYDKDNKIKEITFRNNKIAYGYNANLGRLENINIMPAGVSKYNTSIAYKNNIDGTTTNLIESINNNGKAISYTYDANKNIDTITEDGKTIKYYYNELNELKRENNQVLDKTIICDYDKGGNILSKKEYAYTTEATPTSLLSEFAYTYDTTWKDKLASYDGMAISHDEIGNVLNDGTYTYTWEQGRQLATMSKAGQSISFKYNDAGIRTEKTVNGVNTKYHLVGDRVTYETNGTDKIYYTYSPNGALVSMNQNGVEYYYIKNAQGDIIGLVDNNGTEVVSYTYDSWGKLISIEGTLKDTVGEKNPYRYRGYKYDSETGLYYLNSRYYNPELGRFINADAAGGKVGELLSHNVFAYCLNNPVNMSDPDGNQAKWVKWVVAAAIVVAVAVITVVAIASLQPELLAADAPLIASLSKVTAVVKNVAPKAQQTAQKITSGSQVTENVVREAIKDAPLKTQQGSVSLPAIQRYVDRLINAEIPPAIKVDQGIIVDGNHRYIASRILGMDIRQVPWIGGRVDKAIDLIKIFIDPSDWGNR
jgi:RHS repeat-associated protein